MAVPSWAIPVKDEKPPSWAVPVGGAPKKTLKEAVFPRATQADNLGSQVVGGMLDMASFPGRFIASGNGLDRESMARIEGNGFVDNIARDPALIPSMAVGGPALNAAGKMGLTGLRALGAMGAAEGLTSAGIHQADRAVQGKELQPGIAGAEVAASAVLPFAPTMVNKGIGRIASGLSGPSEEALRTYGMGSGSVIEKVIPNFGKGAKSLAQNAGKQNEIGLNLVDAIDNAHDFMPEKKQVEEALKKMPQVDVSAAAQIYSEAIDNLEKPKAGALPLGEERAAIRALKDDLAAIQGKGKNRPGTSFSAEGVRDLRKRLDATAKFGDDRATDIVNQVRLKARKQLKEDLIAAAKASGNPKYERAMASWSDKLDKVDQIKAILGKSGTTREQRAESFIANLYGKNKSERQRLVGDLGNIFGEDFLSQAKLSKLADELGPDGKPGWLPTQFNGRSTMGTGAVASGLTGFSMTKNPAFLAPVALGALASPRVAAGTLGALDALQTIPGAPVRAGLRSLGQRK